MRARGQIVDLLAAEHRVTVRYNGGANAGHSVRIANEKFALHQVPVGVLTGGTLNVLANGVVLDVDGLLGELRTLAGAGVDVGDNLRISDRALNACECALYCRAMRCATRMDL